MKLSVKSILLGVLAILLLLVLGGITMVGWQIVLGPDARPVTDKKFDVTETRLARGKYLANGPMHCFQCHTEHDMSVPEYPTIAAKTGAGWVMPIPELNNIASRNITPDVETGIGGWSDDEIARAIREGVRKDGTALFPVMPYMDFAAMDDEDLASIVVYLRTIPAVKNTVPMRNLPGPLEYLVKTMPKPVTKPQPSHPSSTPAERGLYLTTLAGCHGCHTPVDDKNNPLPGMAFAGGEVFKDPAQGGKDIATINITQDPSGIAHYDEAMFMETLRTGNLKGRVLNHIMPFEAFKTMTDADISDIFVFLKTVPQVKHRVSNTDPPTPCPLCNKTHGLGELNVKKQ